MIGEVYTNTKIYKDYKMKKITGKEYIKIRNGKDSLGITRTKGYDININR